MTTTIQKIRYKENQSPCGKCGIMGVESPVELLPKGGILMRAIHEDGTEHRWAEYTSMYMGRERKSRNDEDKIMCPKCAAEGKRKIGRINSFHRDIHNHPEIIDYQIVHEKLGVRKHGTWGKEKQPKRNRCYINDPEQRNIILKKLHRYIEQK